jgi:glycosyltransferase involved in cell wall biosynthesis
VLRAIECLQEMADYGHKVVVLTAGKPGVPGSCYDGGIEVLRSPVIDKSLLGRSLRRVIYIIWIIRYLSFTKYDVIHINSLPGIGMISNSIIGILLTSIAQWRRTRTVYVHTLADERTTLDLSGFGGILRKKFLRNVSHLVAISPLLYQSISDQGLDPILLPRGIRDDVFKPMDPARRAKLRRKENLRPDDVVFSFVGSICRRKGFDLLAQAFAALTQDHPGWRLWVIGPRTLSESQNINTDEVCQVTAPLQGLEEIVKYWGRIDDRQQMAEILGESDVFVFPTRREGFGVVAVEAMAVGLPVIISLLPGVTDMANVEGETGFYIPSGDAEALKRTMRQLGEDASLRQRLGRQAALRARQAFGWEAYMKKWELLYRQGSIRDG